MKTESFVLAPISFKPGGVKHQLLIQRTKLREQLEIATNAMQLVINNLSPWDDNINILAEALEKIKKVEEN